MTLCFATNNQHKLAEVRALLNSNIVILGLAEIGCHEELPEEQNTISGNSLQKATYIFEKYKINCFADDSGLEVDALNGEPGVDSAHYAGPQRSFEDNMNLLLKNLTGITDRAAQFKTVITLVSHSDRKQFEGILRGNILTAKKGIGGFGYDPIFLPEGHLITTAEMTMEQKNKISHRALAIQRFMEYLISNPL
jgi:XTP/dITP diphosphohydrolase